MVDQSKLAHMEWCSVWEPSIPSDVTSQANKQQLIWGYPGVLWGEAADVTGGVYILPNGLKIRGTRQQVERLLALQKQSEKPKKLRVRKKRSERRRKAKRSPLPQPEASSLFLAPALRSEPELSIEPVVLPAFVSDEYLLELLALAQDEEDALILLLH